MLSESDGDICHSVEFIEVKKRVTGKLTLQAIVNQIKFYCNKTDKETGRKTFRCSFYDSEGCTEFFKASKVENKWKAETLEYATRHYHESEEGEGVITKAKIALKKDVLAAPLGKRLKDIFNDFIAEYEKTLKRKEKELFDKNWPVFKRLRMTMWRWLKEIVPKAPLKQADLDVHTPFFYNEDAEHLVIGDTTDQFGNRIITLGTPSNMHYFSETLRLNIDCTYKSAPSPDWASVLIFQVHL